MRDERDEFDQQLRQDLGPVPAPEGFADRVMERVAGERKLRFRMVPQRTLHLWQAAIAAMVLIGVLFGAAEWTHKRQEQRQAEVVQRQFDVAMHITEKTLDSVGERIRRAGTKQEER